MSRDTDVDPTQEVCGCKDLGATKLEFARDQAALYTGGVVGISMWDDGAMNRDTVAQLFLDYQAIGESLWNLAMIGVLSWLIVEVIKRLDADFPDNKNFRLAHPERPFLKRELSVEVAIALFNTLLTKPLTALLTLLLVDYVLAPRVGGQLFAQSIESWPFLVQLLIGLVVLDLSLYVRHRFVHAHFWNYHIIHHSTREITWITWLKLHPLDLMLMGLIDAVIMYFLGFGGEAIAGAQLIKFHFNRFCHSNLKLDYGFPLRYIFCSPNMHRWHHAAEPADAHNKNYCIIFAWIDLLFGTFYLPKDEVPEAYGVWDEEGRDLVGTGFVEQMLFPFKAGWRSLRGHGRRDEEAELDPAE